MSKEIMKKKTIQQKWNNYQRDIRSKNRILELPHYIDQTALEIKQEEICKLTRK